MKARVAPLLMVCVLVACERGTETPLPVSAPESDTQSTTAIEDLASRLGVSVGDVQLVSEKSVRWPDGSLGCPKEDMMYTQAQVEGTQIVLSVDGKRYDYHSGKGRTPFLCENPQKPASKPSAD